MANSNRASGRQGPAGVPGSGRQPASTSGRGQAGIPAGQAVPGNRTSGRAGAQIVPPAAPAPAAGTRSSRRVEAEGGRGGVGGIKKRRRGGPELVIAFGVIALLGVVALVLNVVRTKEQRQVAGEIEVRERTYRENLELGANMYVKAEAAGMLFVMGKEEKASDDKLFGPFRNEEKIYNVIYDRNYKDRGKQTKNEQRAMFPDRLRVEKMERGKEENSLRLNYAYADSKTVPLVIANKSIKAAEGDAANLGGSITVIVKAREDRYFEGGRKAKVPPPGSETPPK
ncbi:MAG: hypothetical protein NTW87_22685 [Planctomycetota bacterium]|nr:hypothetical protein [Planctomycetota bacterium]